MTRPTWLDSPFLLGFERMQEIAERAARATDGFPPYNIEHLGEGQIRITLAVAGFRSEDLSAVMRGAQLILRGDRSEPEDASYIHRGIAARRFQRTFVLADGWEVEDAFVKDGLLHVDVRREDPETAERVVSIRVDRGGPGRSNQEGASEDAKDRTLE